MIARNPNLPPSNALRPMRYAYPGPDLAAVRAYVDRWLAPFEDPENEFAHLQPRTPPRRGAKPAPVHGARLFLPASDPEAIAQALYDHGRRGWDPALSLNPVHRRYATGPAPSSRHDYASAVYYVGASIDVGPLEPHATREDALREILHVCEAWGLGAPYLVTWSGRGAHVVWRLSEPAGLGLHDGANVHAEVIEAATLSAWLSCRLQGDKAGAGATSTIRPHGLANAKDPDRLLPVELVSLDPSAGVVATSYPERFGLVDVRHALTLAEAEGEDALRAYWERLYASRPGTGLVFRPFTTTSGGRDLTPEAIACLPLALPEAIASYVRAVSGGHFHEKRKRAEDGTERVAGVVFTRRAPCCLHDGKKQRGDVRSTGIWGRSGRVRCLREGCGANVDGGLPLVEYARRYTPDLAHLVQGGDVRRVDVRTDEGKAAVLANVREALDHASTEGAGAWVGLVGSEPGTGKTYAALRLVGEAIERDPDAAHVLAVDAYETARQRVEEAASLGIDAEMVAAPFHASEGGCLRRDEVLRVANVVPAYSQCERCPVRSSCPVVEDNRPTPATGRLYVVTHDYAPTFLAFARRRGVRFTPGWWDEVPHDDRVTRDELTGVDLATVIAAADSARGGGVRFPNLARWGERWAPLADRLERFAAFALEKVEATTAEDDDAGTIDAADLRGAFVHAIGGEDAARAYVEGFTRDVEDADLHPPVPLAARGPDNATYADTLRGIIPKPGTARRMLDVAAALAGVEGAARVDLGTVQTEHGATTAYVLRRAGIRTLGACIGAKGDGPLPRWVVLAATLGSDKLDRAGIPAPPDRVRRVQPLGPVVDHGAVRARFLRTGRHTLTRKRLIAKANGQTTRLRPGRRGVNVALREGLRDHPPGEAAGLIGYGPLMEPCRSAWTVATDGANGGNVPEARATLDRMGGGFLLPEMEAAALVVPADRFVMSRKFHHLRGSNDYAEVRTLLVIGRPVPNVGELRADALALGLDPDEWIRAATADEMAQTIERARGGRRDASCPLSLVVVGSECPDTLSRYRPEVVDLPRYQGSTPLPTEAEPKPDPLAALRAAVEDHATALGGVSVVGLEHGKARESGFFRLVASNTEGWIDRGPTARESRKMGLCAVPGVLESLAARYGVHPAKVRAVVDEVGRARGWTPSPLPVESKGRSPKGWAPPGTHADYLARVVADPVPFAVDAVDASTVPAAVDAAPEALPEPVEAWDLEAEGTTWPDATIREPITSDELGPALAGAFAKGATRADLLALAESVRAIVRGTGLAPPDLGFAAWVVSRCPPWREWFGPHPDAIPWERFPAPPIDPPAEVASRYTPGEWAARVSRWIEAARSVVWVEEDSRW